MDAEQSLAFWMFAMMRTGRCRPVASKLAVGHRSACMPCIHNSGYIRSRLRQSGAIVLQYKNTNNSTKRDTIHKYHKATEYSHTGCTYIGWPLLQPSHAFHWVAEDGKLQIFCTEVFVGDEYGGDNFVSCCVPLISGFIIIGNIELSFTMCIG